MRVHELLDNIDKANATLIVDDGHLRYTGPRELRPDVARHRDLIVWHITGEPGGHVIGVCSMCGEASLIHVDRDPPNCRMTPRCDGRHVARGVDVERLARIEHRPPPKGARPPARAAKARLLGERPTYQGWRAGSDASALEVGA